MTRFDLSCCTCWLCVAAVLAVLASCSASPEGHPDAEADSARDGESATEERSGAEERLPPLPGYGDHLIATCDPDDALPIAELLARSDFAAIATVDRLEPIFSPVTIEAAPRTWPPRWRGTEDECPGEVSPGFVIRLDDVHVLSGEIPPWAEDPLPVLFNIGDFLISWPRLDDRGEVYWTNPEYGAVVPGHRLLIIAICDEQLGLCSHQWPIMGELDDGSLYIPRHMVDCLPDLGHTLAELAERVDEDEVQWHREQEDASDVRDEIRDDILTMYRRMTALCTVHDRDVHGFPEPHRCTVDADCADVYPGGFCRREACHHPTDFGPHRR